MLCHVHVHFRLANRPEYEARLAWNRRVSGLADDVVDQSMLVSNISLLILNVV